MPRDESLYRFACEICGDRFESADRAAAHTAAASCESQGLETEPLPVGTAVLTCDFEPDANRRQVRIRRVARAEVGSGRYQQGAGHQIKYHLDGPARQTVRPREILPHGPGRLNTLLVPTRDTRSLGDLLHRAGFHAGAYGNPDARLERAAKIAGQLTGAEIAIGWFSTVFGCEITVRNAFPVLAPRGRIGEELLAALDALARPIGAAELPDDLFARIKGNASHLIRFRDEGGVKPHFPNPYPAAWAYALEAASGRVAAARNLLLCHRDDLAAILRARSDAWWAGEDVSLPMQLLVPADGTKTGAMSASQSAVLEGVGDVQREPRPRSEYSPRTEWREGAIRVWAMPPTRRNMKTPRYRPADALAGIAGHHPEIRSTSPMPGSDRPAVPVICVASGKGGVGKSTVAASLAMALTRSGVTATLLDLDLEGPSLPSLLDLPAAEADGERIAPHVLGDGTSVFSPGQLWPAGRALTWETATLEAVVHFLAGGLELGDSRVLVVDLPPGTPEVQTLVNGAWAPAGTVLVTTGSRVAHADLRRAHQAARNPLGIVENLTRAQAEVDGRTVEVRLYDGASTEKLAAELAVPFLGSLPHRPDPADLAGADEMAPLVAATTKAIAAD